MRMGHIVGILIGIVLMSACSFSQVGNKKEQSARVLAAQGIVVHSLDYQFIGWGCSEDDVFNFKFKGLTKDGAQVKGHVCSSWFKGATVRYN